MSRLRVGSAWLAALLLVTALVCAGLVIGNRTTPRPAGSARTPGRCPGRRPTSWRCSRRPRPRPSLAGRPPSTGRTRAGGRERRAAEAQQAADEAAARGAPRSGGRRASRRRRSGRPAGRPRPRRRPPRRWAAAGHDLTGSVTEPDVTGALVLRVGGDPGQPLTALDAADRATVARLRDQLAAGRTLACKAGSGGGYEDILAGAPWSSGTARARCWRRPR